MKAFSFQGLLSPAPQPKHTILSNLMGGHRAENKSKAPKAAGLWPMQIHEVNQTSTRRPRCPKVRPDRLGPNLPNHSLSERVVHLLDFFMNCLYLYIYIYIYVNIYFGVLCCLKELCLQKDLSSGKARSQGRRRAPLVLSQCLQPWKKLLRQKVYLQNLGLKDPI